MSEEKKQDAGVKPADAPTDAAVQQPRCNPTASFGAPVAITEINTGGARDESASLSPDELTVYFSSNRTGTLGGYDIFMATRASKTAMWSNIVPVTGVNTADGLTMYATAGSNPNYQRFG